jgi:uncharacterized protein with predicted RNA binding PUA domain
MFGAGCADGHFCSFDDDFLGSSEDSSSADFASHRHSRLDSFIIQVMFIVVEKSTRCLDGALSLDRDLQRIWSVADFQFGRGVGHLLFPRNVRIEYSRRTGRIRYVYLNGIRLATMRPTDGLFSLSLVGAERLAGHLDKAKCVVTVKGDVSEFVAAGGDVFAVHVLHADEDIRAKDEAVVVDENKNVLAVGRAVLSSEEMTSFKRGVAVKVRRGIHE